MPRTGLIATASAALLVVTAGCSADGSASSEAEAPDIAEPSIAMTATPGRLAAGTEPSPPSSTGTLLQAAPAPTPWPSPTPDAEDEAALIAAWERCVVTDWTGLRLIEDTVAFEVGEVAQVSEARIVLSDSGPRVAETDFGGGSCDHES